ncbi:MAG: hypothetical protein KME49_22545 [Brasilonema octagenarum HA4186-MV1]|jgi:hypothetical protein|nr:hypothetical protein [Brasilonema octagenarum HA4186-MV1]
MPSGGARPNAGRKRKYAEKSHNKRVPAGWSSDDVTEAVKAREVVRQMRTVVENWHAQADSTDKPDAIYLLQELENLLFGGCK